MTALMISDLRYHRNGVAGAGFYAARVAWKGDGRTYHGTAVVFDAAEHVAVTIDGDVRTCFRCEDFERELRSFIATREGQAMAFRQSA